ncbi:hypothetical protein BROUX41_001573 [Berkeleyomyces rouxiae]|uniref:uncharacterized protein n=1 Tax=Berkeleyomyces rouxiae TaxID=2035830 RepID=UPI003B814C14
MQSPSHFRTPSTDNSITTCAAAAAGKPPRTFRRPSKVLSFDRRSLSAMTYKSAMSAGSGADALDSIRHKAPFIGVVSTYGDVPRDNFLDALFNPTLRPPISGQVRPYTSVTLQDRPWRCWVDKVVHPLTQPEHFTGQLAQLDVLVILYSTQSAASFTSVVKICERYLDTVPPYGSSPDASSAAAASASPSTSTSPTHATTPGHGPPLPVIVATGSAPLRPLVVGDSHVPPADGMALAAKYNGRFVELDSFSDARHVQRPIEAAVASWAKGHTQVDLLLAQRTGSTRSENDGSSGLSDASAAAVPPSNSRRNTDSRDKRKNSSHTERRSKDSRSSLPPSVEQRDASAAAAAAPNNNTSAETPSPMSPVSAMSAPFPSCASANSGPAKKEGRMSRVFRALKRRVNSSTK